MADDLGYGGISSFGNKNIQTPNIDALAKEGVKFIDFHSNGAVCSPTRAALMTGKYQQRTGIEGVVTAFNHRHVGLDLQEITIADEFTRIGYNCGMFGKWHLGYSKDYNPTLQGFETFVGFVSGNIDYHAHLDNQGYVDWWKGTRIDNEVGYTTDLITKYAISYLKEKNPKKTKKPFFLYLPHEAPHAPFQRRIDRALREEGSTKTKSVPLDSITSIYKEMVEVMDEGIGQIVQVLKEMGQYENTIILFLSDNGANNYGNNGGLRGFKGGVYEGGSRVPAILTYPKKIKKGTVNKELVLTMDLLPTLLDFANATPSSKQIDGISIKDNLLNQTALPERDVFFSYRNKSFVRSGNWKLIRKNNEMETKFELYDLEKDLQEKHDLSSNHLELIKKLNIKLKEWENEVRKYVQQLSTY
jgi:arylsulfatase A-like enzyme